MRLSDFNVDALSKSLRLPRETNKKKKKVVLRPCFAIQIALSLRPGANFAGLNLKVLRRRQSLTILTSQPLSRHSLVQILPT